MATTPCCDKDALRRGPWAAEEDEKLVDYIQKHGHGNWRTLPKNAGLQRCGKSCRLRWTNYLRPDIKRGRFSAEEEQTIIQLHSVLGNKWSAIAARLPGRTDNEIKNYWNTHIRKTLLRMGIDPVTHSPRVHLLDVASIFNSSGLCDPSHQQLLYASTLNPELVSLAASLLCSHNHLSPYPIPQNVYRDTQFTDSHIPPYSSPVHPNQNQPCAAVPFPEQGLPSSSHVGRYHSDFDNFGSSENSSHHPNAWQMPGDIITSQGYCYVEAPQYGSAQPDHHHPMFVSENNQQSFGFASGSGSVNLSPSSISNSATCINSGGADDERESDCGDWSVNFEIQHLMDAYGFV